MSARRYIYNTMAQFPGLQALVSDRVFQGESLITAQVTKPFVVYRVGNETNELFAEQDLNPRQVFFQVYCHSAGPDYTQVDDLVEQVKAAFRAKPEDPTNRVMGLRYLETSRDLDDETMMTVFRYIRFQCVVY